MQTFKNLLLQKYSTKFLDITYKWSLGMCNQSLFKWWRHLHYWQNNSQRQFEHANSPWVCVIKVCSNGGATYIICEIIAKDNLNIENLMQTFKNLLLQNYSTKFLDITHK